jgi:hypothetical protein
MDGKTAQRSARVSRVLTEQARLHEDLIMPPLVMVQDSVWWTTRMWSPIMARYPVQLPEDIWRHIASFMDGKTAQRSARVSRVLREQARLHEDLIMPQDYSDVEYLSKYTAKDEYDDLFLDEDVEDLFGSDSEDEDDLPALS